jgi:hypothetical protein
MLVGRRIRRKKEKKKEKRSVQGAFVPGLEWDTPCWLLCVGFLWLLDAIKG